MSLQSVVSALREAGANQIERADGTYFSCPLHPDRNPSLAVAEGRNGSVILKCFPCESRYIDNTEFVTALLARLGLSWSHVQPAPSGPRRLEDVYPYHREDGQYLFSVLRYEPKEFRQAVIVSESPWMEVPGGLGGIAPIPFRLPELKRALQAGEPTYICEGEADVLALVSRGPAATCNPGGAGKWRHEFSEHFRGSSSPIYIVPDWDPPEKGARGQQHALDVAESLSSVGVSVEFLRAATGKDVRDHLAAGHAVAELLSVSKEDLQEQVRLGGEAAKRIELGGQVQDRFNLLKADKLARQLLAEEEASGLFRGFESTSLAEMLSEDRPETPWLIERLMRTGHKAILTSGFKAGKTTLIANVVRATVDRLLFLDRFRVGDFDGNVVVFDYELTRADAADMYKRVGIDNAERVIVETLRGSGFSLANETHVQQTIRFFRDQNCQLWIIDPLARAMRGFGSENSNDDVGNFLAQIDRIAAAAGLLGVIISAHTGRGEQIVGEEHARGATKIDDDPDVRWVLTKEADNRFFRAEGRNQIDCPEISLVKDTMSDRLVAQDLSRHDVRMRKRAMQVARIVQDSPRISAGGLQARMPGKDEKTKRPYIAYAVEQQWITETAGPRNSKIYDVGPKAPPIKFVLPGLDA